MTIASLELLVGMLLIYCAIRCVQVLPAFAGKSEPGTHCTGSLIALAAAVASYGLSGIITEILAGLGIGAAAKAAAGRKRGTPTPTPLPSPKPVTPQPLPSPSPQPLPGPGGGIEIGPGESGGFTASYNPQTGTVTQVTPGLALAQPSQSGAALLDFQL